MLTEEIESRISIEHEGDWEIWCAGVGTSFRSMAENDARWLWWAIDWTPNELLALSQWIVSVGGMFPPASMDWPEWMDAIAGGSFFTLGHLTMKVTRDPVSNVEPVEIRRIAEKTLF